MQYISPYLLRAAGFASLVGILYPDQVLSDFNHCVFPLQCLLCVGYLFFLLFATQLQSVGIGGWRILQGKGGGDCIHSTMFSLWHSKWYSISDFHLLMQTEETNWEMLVVECSAVVNNPKVRKIISGSLKNRTGAEDERGSRDWLKRPDWQKSTHSDTFKLHKNK